MLLQPRHERFGGGYSFAFRVENAGQGVEHFHGRIASAEARHAAKLG